ncbi:hypothetical protein J437_LFUL017545 [Ladona fulva]|uniref:C2H2-type domain-containing protein n=1 Tax=Ladona fulva TaxID=123851 RepID=A0A8K0KM54_LADFU|nr:hypothetical protein J437_LFUL017545 [Ladona fulva]
MASTTVSSGAVSVSGPSETSPGPFVEVMALGGSSDPQSEDGDDSTRRDNLSMLEYDEFDDQRPRASPSKRRLDDSDMDFCQTAKKRRKQYKPVRIAVPAVSNTGEEKNQTAKEFISSTPGVAGPEDEGYEGEEDGVIAPKFDDVKEGLQARMSADTKVLDSASLQQTLERSESTFAFKCFDCAEAFASPEALAEHDQVVHRQQTQQNPPVTPSSATSNPPKRDIPLDLAQGQGATNSDQPMEYSMVPWASAHSRTSPGITTVDCTPKSRGSPSQIPPIPFSMNPFGDGKILIPNFLGMTPPFLLPHIPEKSSAIVSQGQPTMTTGSTDNSSSTIRIFNPEAYCELCNKEFCNKYFLKTHKANKHGIYSDTSTMSGGGNNYPGASFSNAPSMSNMVPNRPTLANVSLSASKTTAEMNSLPKSSGSVQMKLSCEVCHKKFSNRYLVLRHKAKVHGIVDDSFLGSELAGKIGLEYWPKLDKEELGNTSTSSETGSVPFENQLNENNASTQADFLGEPRPFSREKTNISPQVSTNKSSPSMSFKLSPSNSFTELNMEQEEVKQQLQQDFTNTPSTPETGTTHSSVQTSTPSNNWSSFPVSPSVSTPKVSNLSHERLRKMGVINADAFCEICCKEYCNKYFLRTHKLKRHGIVTPEFEAKGSNVGSGRSFWNPIQTSPLNLIVGEQSGSNWATIEKNQSVERQEKEEIKRESSISNGTNNMQTDLPEGERLECNVCGRHFQSHYLMQMHRAYMHATPSNAERNNSDEMSFSEAAAMKSRCNSNGSNTRDDQSPSNLLNPSMTSENSQLAETGGISQSDFVSGNLQKIQTMIMQLNKFNEGKINCCTICNKEVEDKFMLRSHMITEHGVMIDDEKEIRTDENSSDSPSSQGYPSSYCSICKKDFFAKCFLKKHITEFHGNILPKAMKEEIKETAERTPNQQIEKQVSVTPTSSYCEICNKELCNKYFMKTHMQRMHGIEIENGSQIGGVICDICNKELCSKYFLRVHKQNTHGIVEDAGVLLQSKDNGSTSLGTPPAYTMPALDSNDQSLKPSDAGDMAHRYFTHFTEVCPICNRRFRSTKWLKAHLMNDHSETGVEKWKELELQYQIQLQQTRQVMAKAQSSATFSSKSSQALENGGGATLQTWKTNIGTQSEFPMSFSEITDSSGIRKSAQDMDGCQDNSPQVGVNYACNEKKMQQKVGMSCTDNGNGTEKHKNTNTSNLFGTGNASVKNYHCSFCPFRTPVLAYLFVHEKSHAVPQSPPHQDTKKQFQCTICHQSFVRTDMFQHHLLTHQYSGLLGSITSGSPVVQTYNNSSDKSMNSNGSQRANDANTVDDVPNIREPIVEVIIDEQGGTQSGDEGGTYKLNCTKCNKSFKSQELLLIHAQNKDECDGKDMEVSPPKNETDSPAFSPVDNNKNDSCSPVPVPSSFRTEHDPLKCTHCPFSTNQVATLKKHIMEDHPGEVAEAISLSPSRECEQPKGVGCGEDGDLERASVEWASEAQCALGMSASFESGELEAAMELRRRLEEAARQSQVPASYAVPQRVRLREEGLGRTSFIMQPFLLEEPDEARGSSRDGNRFPSQPINGSKKIKYNQAMLGIIAGGGHCFDG